MKTGTRPAMWRILGARRLGLGALLAAVAVQGLGSSPGVSATTTVNVACGDVAGLAAAIQGASAGTLINLNSNNVSGCRYVPTATYAFPDGPLTLPAITTTLTIAGRGSTIDAGSATGPVTIFGVEVGGYLTLSDATLTNGNGQAAGAIVSHGRLLLQRSTLSNNSGRGALFADGSATTLTDSTVTLSRGLGAAIYSCCGTLTISGSTISNNRSYDYKGGGVYAAGTVNISGTTISGNESDDTIGGGHGGGMYLEYGSLKIDSSTFGYNRAEFGGGLHANGTIELDNVNFTGNQAIEPSDPHTEGAYGGGLAVGGTLVYHGGVISDNVVRQFSSPGPVGGGISASVTGGEVCALTFSGNSPDDVAGTLPGCSGNHLSVTCAPLSGAEGKALYGMVATFSDSDPAATASNLTVAVDWGDGGKSPAVVTGSGSFQASSGHTYGEGGRYPVLVTVEDPDGGFGWCTGRAAISDPALHLRMAATPLITPTSTPLDGPLAYLTDDDTASSVSEYKATIFWGDGTAPTYGTVLGSNGSYQIRGHHLYLRPGSYKVTVKVVDAGGSSASASASVAAL